MKYARGFHGSWLKVLYISFVIAIFRGRTA